MASLPSPSPAPAAAPKHFLQFADFSREHKLYNPDDQLKQAITQVSAYDKSIADLQSQQKAAQAQYDVATNKLGSRRLDQRQTFRR